MRTPLDLVREVAKLILDDQLCYVEKQARKIHSFPIDELKTPEVIEKIQLIEKKMERYIKIPPMPKQNLIWTMEAFLLVGTDEDIMKELKSGLSRKNPIRNFTQVLENRPDINQHWRMFRKEKMEEYVSQAFIDDYNY